MNAVETFPVSRGERLQQLRRRASHWLMRTVFGRARGEISAARLPGSGIHRILVCHVSHTLGNTLLLTPLLHELRRVYPGAEVDVVTRSGVADEVFGSFGSVRNIYRVPAHGLRVPWRLISLMRALRRQRYDLAIDPSVRSQSDRIGILAAKAKWKLGYAGQGQSGALSHGIARPGDVRHVGHLPVYLLRSALGHTAHSPYPPLDICLSEREREEGKKALACVLAPNRSSSTPVVGVFAGATGPKDLGPDWWQRFTQRLVARYPDQCFVEILPIAGVSLLGDRFPTFYSSDVRRLAGLLSALSLFVSADCGVMHLACAAGSPTVGVFSVTDPAQWGPCGPRDTVLEIGTRTPEESADLLSLGWL